MSASAAVDPREVILEARELTREFDGVKALDKFSLKLHRGQVLGLAARSSGKGDGPHFFAGAVLF